WQRGRPPFYNYIDAVLLPDVPRDKAYTFRVQKGNIDLGTHPTYPPEDNGSQKVNFLEYNEGYGIRDDTSIGVYARDPETESEHLVAQW
ncbi:immunomodulatory protein FIP-Fve, partial [Cytidiella melzeri]